MKKQTLTHGFNFGQDPHISAQRLLSSGGTVDIVLSKDAFHTAPRFREIQMWFGAISCLFELKHLLTEDGVELGKDPEVFLPELGAALKENFAAGAQFAKLELSLLEQQETVGRCSSVLTLTQYSLRTRLFFGKSAEEYLPFEMEGQELWYLAEQINPLRLTQPEL